MDCEFVQVILYLLFAFLGLLGMTGGGIVSARVAAHSLRENGMIGTLARFVFWPWILAWVIRRWRQPWMDRSRTLMLSTLSAMALAIMCFEIAKRICG